MSRGRSSPRSTGFTSSALSCSAGSSERFLADATGPRSIGRAPPAPAESLRPAGDSILRSAQRLGLLSSLDEAEAETSPVSAPVRSDAPAGSRPLRRRIYPSKSPIKNTPREPPAPTCLYALVTSSVLRSRICCRPGAVLTPETGRAVRPLAPRSPGVARPCQAPLVAKLLPDGRYSRPTDNLTQQKTPHERGFLWSGRRGSNPRPSAWEADALPTELRPRWPQDSASDFWPEKQRDFCGPSRALPERSPGAGCGTAHLRRGFMGETWFPPCAIMRLDTKTQEATDG